MNHHQCCIRWLRGLFDCLESPKPAAPGSAGAFRPKVRMDVFGKFHGRLAYAQLQCGNPHEVCEYVVFDVAGSVLASGRCNNKCAG